MALTFPFAAIVGQDEMTLAIQVVAVDPSIGGVLVLGDRGTGKSTAVRALADLLPPISVVKGCPYRCDPAKPAGACPVCQARDPKAKVVTERQSVAVVDLPLGATEDRVVGALDLEKALSQGVKSFAPGLLAQAHRGFLYIDEVNLLDDHLVDLLIDVAASGENLVEREGLSVRHPARFVLVGSGNPEEGELRPQLLDRFGLSVQVRTPQDLALRVSIIKRRDAFDKDPEAFKALWHKDNQKLQKRILKARDLLDEVEVSDDMLMLCTRLCQQLGTDGLRAELTLLRATRAYAALQGHKAVKAEHLQSMAPLALRHRLRRNPLDDTDSGARVQRSLQERWNDALTTLQLLQLDPFGFGGVCLCAPHGPVRERWLQALAGLGLGLIKVPGSVDSERLLGGIDLAHTLQTGQLHLQAGLLQQADQGLVCLPMAERLSPALLAPLVQALEQGQVPPNRHSAAPTPTRFGVVALDESLPDEPSVGAALAERLGVWLDLHELSPSDIHAAWQGDSESEGLQIRLSPGALARAREQLPQVQATDEQLQALCAAALGLGIGSLRVPSLALRVACGHAALNGPRSSASSVLRAGPPRHTMAGRAVCTRIRSSATFNLPFELLRVYSPSAEVKGHGAGQEVLQVGKREVGIAGIEPVGNYAVQPTFSDGHNTGLFTWDYLYKLGAEQEQLWQDYLARLRAGTTWRACAPPASTATADANPAPPCPLRPKRTAAATNTEDVHRSPPVAGIFLRAACRYGENRSSWRCPDVRSTFKE
eukprot:gene13381-15409_t